MLFTLFPSFSTKSKTPVSSSLSNHDIFLKTVYLLIFYLIFPAHVMKEDNDEPKDLLFQRLSLSKTPAPRQMAQ